MAGLTRSFRFQLYTGVGLVLLAVWIAIAQALSSAHREALEQASAEGRNLARSLSAHVATLVSGVDLLLLNWRQVWLDMPGAIDDHLVRDREQLHKHSIVHIAIMNPRGWLVWDSVPGWQPGDYSDRDHIKVHMRHEADGLYVSVPVLGRVSKQRTIQFTRGIYDRHQKLAGVIVFSVPPPALEQVYNDLQLNNGSIALVRSDGQFLARSTNLDRALGTPLDPARSQGLSPQDPVSGAFRQTSVVDGVDSHISYHKVPDYPLVVYVRQPIGSILAAFHVQRTRYLVGGAFATLLLVLLALLLDRRRVDNERAERNRAWLAAIVQGSDEAIVSTDMAGRIETWNRGAERIFGYSAAEAVGQSARELITPADRLEELLEGQERVDRGEAVAPFDTVRVAKDGRRVDVSVGWSPIKDAQGTVIGVSTILRDITERKRADSELRTLSRAMEQSPAVIVITDKAGSIEYANPRFEQVTGYTRDEAVGSNPRILKSGMTPEETYKDMWKAISEGGEWRGELCNRRKNGDLFWEFAAISGIRGENGDIEHYIAVKEDITERKQAEAERALLETQLRESQKMQAIGTLAGGIAHDFNNALATILGNAELARQDMSANPLALESLEEIRKAGARARDLVQQILAFSRRQPTERKPLALASVVEESIRLLRATLPARVALDVFCDTDVPTVLADASQMQHVLINLCTNATHAMRGGPGRIGIRLDTVTLDSALAGAHPELRALHAKRPGRTVRLAVSDNGCGMDADTLSRIFEPFFTTKPLGEGTGLGLSIVHGIVHGHEGAIVVDSKPGRGATFTLYFPVAAVQSDAPSIEAGAPTESPGMGGGRRILYIDDDEALVFLVQRLLERRGFRVSGYTNQGEALAALRANPAGFDLVVSDYNMPGMSGLDVAREVRAIRAELPLAVTSGFIDEELRAQAGKAGVRELIFKADALEVLCEAFARLAQSAGEKSKSS